MELPKNSSIGILQHDNTDPDSVGASIALEKIIGLTGHRAKSLYSGTILKGQNQWIIDRLRIRMVNIDQNNGKRTVEPSHYYKFFLVDTPGDTVEWYRKGKIGIDQIFGRIDHHPPLENSAFDYTDLRKVGAASSILASYYHTKISNDSALVFLRDNTLAQYLDSTAPKVLKRISTMLYIGILTDIDYLHGDHSEFDQKMLLLLWKNVDLKIVSEYKQDSESLATEKEKAQIILNISKCRDVGIAYSNRRIRSDIALAWPKAANDIRSIENINTAYVIGFNKKTVSIFVRTRKENPDYQGLAELLGGSGGGKENGDGRIDIPIKNIVGGDTTSRVRKNQRYDTEAGKQIYEFLRPKLCSYRL